jgi:beta-galactosidase
MTQNNDEKNSRMLAYNFHPKAHNNCMCSLNLSYHPHSRTNAPRNFGKNGDKVTVDAAEKNAFYQQLDSPKRNKKLAPFLSRAEKERPQKHSRITIAAALTLSFLFTIGTLQAQTPHTLRANGDRFELDGKPFQIISGAIHSSRVPRAYWRDRLRKARAMGLNTVETYVFWNVYESSPGKFDFSGQNDIAEFVREAQQEGLFVILRPGPYACAEWDFGGYPAWLLHDPTMEVRTSNPAFIAASSRWLHRLGQELAPLQSENGGPIIAVQVENEYGSFGSDHSYMEQIHHLLLDSGFNKAMLYTADGADQVPNGSLPELPAVINFGSGNAKAEFAKFAKTRPNSPRMCGEYWDGWFDHWGGKHHTTDPEAEAKELQWMLEQGYSVNLYMFHGGTSFGWMNGANIDAGKYEPDVTSYDYDVPVGESGELRPKYFLFRDVIGKVTGITPPAPPTPIQAQTRASINLTQSASIWDNLPQPVKSEKVLSMEDVGQSYGYILYRTSIAKAQSGELHIDQLRDYAQVYLDGKLVGTLDRRLDQSSITVNIAHDNTRLDILVENTGRVNFGRQFPHERAGITNQVTLANKALTGWQIYALLMQNVSSLPYNSQECTGACFYHAAFHVEDPADTFIDARSLGKGEVFVNGKPLGRFWNIGPQRTLYLPAPWLKKGENEIVVFDLNGKPKPTVPFLAHPILDDNSN